MRNNILFASLVIGLLHFNPPAIVHAMTIDLNFTASNTAKDNGPQDGVFDAFSPIDFGAVNNNGFTSFRTAMEFALPTIPPGAGILDSMLTFSFGFIEGVRQIALYGYTGDGSIQLTDMSSGVLLGSTTLFPSNSQTVVFDTTLFMKLLYSGGSTFAGFNVREEPANSSNFTVLHMTMSGANQPQLALTVPIPDTLWPFLAGFMTLAVWWERRKAVSPSMK